jgi:hypothetical protein
MALAIRMTDGIMNKAEAIEGLKQYEKLCCRLQTLAQNEALGIVGNQWEKLQSLLRQKARLLEKIATVPVPRGDDVRGDAAREQVFVRIREVLRNVTAIEEQNRERLVLCIGDVGSRLTHLQANARAASVYRTESGDRDPFVERRR